MFLGAIFQQYYQKRYNEQRIKNRLKHLFYNSDMFIKFFISTFENWYKGRWVAKSYLFKTAINSSRVSLKS